MGHSDPPGTRPGDGARDGRLPPDGETLAAEFARWAAQDRASAAAESRQRSRWLGQQASETATMAGILLDLAERTNAVVLCAGGQTFRGALVGVGKDFCAVDEAERSVVVRLGAVTTVRAHDDEGSAPTDGPTAGDRVPPLAMGFVDTLTALASERNHVGMVLADGRRLSGDLVAVGTDVVSLRGPRPSRRITVVSLPAAVACWAD